MQKICKDIQIGYTTIKDFNIVGIDDRISLLATYGGYEVKF